MSDKKISELTSVSSLQDTDLIPISQDQGDGTYLSRKINVNDFTIDPIVLGNLSGAVTVALVRDTHHTASITNDITSWTLSGLSNGNGCTLELTNSGSKAVAITGITADWADALNDIASPSVLVVIRVSGTTYRGSCKALA